MGTVIPDSEALRRAIIWISENLKEKSEQSRNSLLQEAALRFNLSPKDTEFIHQFYKNKE
jgi:hypothetical protein